MGIAIALRGGKRAPACFRSLLKELDNVEPGDVIMSPALTQERGLTSMSTFPVGNIAPEGSVIKSTDIVPASSIPTAPTAIPRGA